MEPVKYKLKRSAMVGSSMEREDGRVNEPTLAKRTKGSEGAEQISRLICS